MIEAKKKKKRKKNVLTIRDWFVAYWILKLLPHKKTENMTFEFFNKSINPYESTSRYQYLTDILQNHKNSLRYVERSSIWEIKLLK